MLLLFNIKIMLSRFALTLLFTLTVICCYAEQIRFYGKGELSCNLITEICQDKNGFIWIGTADGLNKFDGWTFSGYFHKSDDENSLLSDYIYCLYSDNKGEVWIGTNKGLQLYIPEKDAFMSVRFPDNLIPSVEGVVELHTGEIWVVTSGRGTFSVDRTTMKAKALTDVNQACGNLLLSHIFKDSFNNIWIPVPENKILRVLPGDGDRFRVYETSDAVESFTENEQGQFYISSSQNISRWDQDNQSFVLVKNLPATFMKPQILSGKDGIIYIGTNGQGLYYLEPGSMEIHPVNETANREVNLRKIKVESMFKDKSGNIWIGCFRKGLLMIPNELSLFNFMDFSKLEYESGKCISSVYRGVDGMIWAGAENGELMNLDENGNILASYIFKNTVSSICEDSGNSFWVGTNYGGLFRFDKRTGNKVSMSGFENDYIKAIIEDKERNTYFSVFGKGLMLYNQETHKRKQILSNDDITSLFLKNNWINIMMCDSEGKVWTGHYKGIDCYDPHNDVFCKIKGDSILHSAICYSLLEGDKGVIWIGTNNGLYKYSAETEQFVHYTTEKGLPDNVICGLAKDNSGNIWCSTYRGLCKINVTDNSIYPYSSGNGLFDKEYTRSIYFQYNKRDVYFGGVYGITHFIPDSIYLQEFNNEPVLTNLHLNNHKVNTFVFSAGRPISDTELTEASHLYLSYRDNTFTLEFSTMDYNEPDNIHFEYRMVEVSEEWSQTPPGYNRITYNRLPYGNYSLEIRARENGIYSPMKKITITIVPPWYLSSVAKCFYTLTLLLFVCILYYFLRRRIKKKRQEEINEAKLQFFTNISHEIRSPITLIISPLSMLIKREYDEVTTKALQTMNRNANRIARLLNQLLDIHRIDKGLMKLTFSHTNIVEFIEEITKGFEYQAEKWKINLRFEHDASPVAAWIDRNNFDKILTNLLSNAFKFTPKEGEIIISLSSGNDFNRKDPLRNYIEISVKDSGIGLDEKKLDKIFERFYQLPTTTSSSGSGIGLNLCKTLVELHHGIISAANRKDIKGSCFTIRVPSGNEHLKKEEIAKPDSLAYKNSEHNSYFEIKDEVKNKKNKSKSKVMIIDDDESICLYLKEELSPYYNVTTYNNGLEALRSALKTIPDLIISDVIMPEMDGFTFLKSIKKNNNTSHIPVILLTSRTEYDYRIKGWDKGADAILAKPFSIEELLLLCTNLISGRVHLKGKFTGVQDQNERIKPVRLKSNEEQLMDRIMNVINKNINNPQLNVELLAKEAAISRVQLHRKLKEMAGISAGDFIRNIRLKQAAEILKSKDINISQVAYAVGYNSPSLFSAAFKKLYGISPTEYAEKDTSVNEN